MRLCPRERDREKNKNCPLTMWISRLTLVCVSLFGLIDEHEGISINIGTQFIFAGFPTSTPRCQVTLHIYTVTYKSLKKNAVKIHVPSLLEIKPHMMYLTMGKAEEYNVKDFTAAHVIEGTEWFTVTAFYSDFTGSMGATHVMPVSLWREAYYVVTTGNQPFIVVLSAEGPNTIEFEFRLSEPQLLEFMADDWAPVYFDKPFQITLEKYDAFSLHGCEDEMNFDQGSLTGTRIEGNFPIAVMSGGCKAVVATSCCESHVKRCSGESTGDFFVESILPVEMLGREYISFVMGHRGSLPLIVVVATEPQTTVKVATDLLSGVDTFIMERRGDNLELPDHYGSAVITGDKAIQVMQFQRSHCVHMMHGKKSTTDPGEPALGMLVPTILFFHTYFWSTFVMLHNYMIVIVPDLEVKHMYHNKELLKRDAKWSSVMGKSDWKTGSFKLSPGDHEVYHEKLVYFGCYIYGFNDMMGFLTSAGFMGTAINGITCNGTDTVRGDKIDNDCDGFVDEEKPDKIDNDEDDLIDEDLQDYERTNGGWSDWLPWRCTENCADKRMVRNRFCTNPQPHSFGAYCVGDGEVFRAGSCYELVASCPTECPLRHWGESCLNTCPYCLTDCDKYNGACNSCIAGFHLPQTGCIACDNYRYGFNCTENCRLKCGGLDCEDRVTGSCQKPGSPSEPIHLPLYALPLMSLLFMIPIIVFVIYCLKKSRKKESVDYDEIETIIEASSMHDESSAAGSSVSHQETSTTHQETSTSHRDSEASRRESEATQEASTVSSSYLGSRSTKSSYLYLRDYGSEISEESGSLT